MSRILRNLVLLTLVGELMLPTGWCCRPAQSQASSEKPVTQAPVRQCCQAHQPKTEKPAPAHCPAPASTQCCCSNDSSLPDQGPALPGLDLTMVVPIIVPVVDAPRDELCRVVSGLPVTGPPRNVLLCVWVC